MNEDDDDKPQSEKFKDAARKHGADEDEQRWRERLRRVAKPKKPATPDAR